MEPNAKRSFHEQRSESGGGGERKDSDNSEVILSDEIPDEVTGTEAVLSGP